LFCVNAKRPIIGHLNVMAARVDELRLLKLRIADFERRIADELGEGRMEAPQLVAPSGLCCCNARQNHLLP
jgi:hypothetical protein